MSAPKAPKIYIRPVRPLSLTGIVDRWAMHVDGHDTREDLPLSWCPPANRVRVY